MTRPIVPVVLCGGSGTRLWPLSSAARPKQLLRLVGQHTMLQETLLRLKHFRGAVEPPIVVCNERHEREVRQQVEALGGPRGETVLEPVGRNSAPAAAIAALLARRAAGETEPLLLVLPADHVIADPLAFAAAVEIGIEAAAEGYLTTFGVVPTAPATGYGYIRCGEGRGRWSRVAQFAEKPDRATARAYVDSGEYLWNSGIFLFAASAWLEELRRFAPELLRGCERALEEAATAEDGVTRLGAAFRACPADSIDYAVMERTERAAVVPLSAGWSDVGSWSSLHDVLPKDDFGNAASGDALLEGCRNTCVVGSGERLIAAIGLDGVIIVETPDALLVVAREHAEAVKRIADRASKKGGAIESR